MIGNNSSQSAILSERLDDVSIFVCSSSIQLLMRNIISLTTHLTRSWDGRIGMLSLETSHVLLRWSFTMSLQACKMSAAAFNAMLKSLPETREEGSRCVMMTIITLMMMPMTVIILTDMRMKGEMPISEMKDARKKFEEDDVWWGFEEPTKRESEDLPTKRQVKACQRRYSSHLVIISFDLQNRLFSFEGKQSKFHSEEETCPLFHLWRCFLSECDLKRRCEGKMISEDMESLHLSCHLTIRRWTRNKKLPIHWSECHRFVFTSLWLSLFLLLRKPVIRKTWRNRELVYSTNCLLLDYMSSKNDKKLGLMLPHTPLIVIKAINYSSIH